MFAAGARPKTVPDFAITIKRYDASNTLLGSTSEVITSDTLVGYLCSLNIAFEELEETADHLLISIE